MTTTNHEPNKLIQEKSPYLQLHAYNPIKWYPWGAEAFDLARKENKPIFLSIGYAACHWCHVMARESFEDEKVAKILNKYFISIKVDREERPDIDTVYMAACQAINGEGGWPLNVFLTPNKKPFYAGTYFPKEDKPWQTGLKTLLLNIAEKWSENQDSISDNANKISEFLNKRENFKDEEINMNTVKEASESLINSHDKVYGGFGNAPKFPMPQIPMFLLKYYEVADDDEALFVAENTLLSIYKGGIHDHIGGGYCRYSTDEKWLVPHFEKMLYDNALLAIAFTKAFTVTKKDIYQAAAEDILNFLNKEMKSPEGGFYSAISAETSKGEGDYYTWDKKEVLSILNGSTADEFCEYYNISNAWSFKGKCIPHIDTHIMPYKFTNELKALLEEREKREKPEIDKKILTAQNALAVWAFSYCAKEFKNEDYLKIARNAADFILRKLRGAGGRLLARYIDDEAKYLAYSDDYAFMILALISLYEAGGGDEYLDYAISLMESALLLFWAEDGGLYFYGADAEELISRPKEAYDGSIPSANSVLALALKKLYNITKNPCFKDKENDIYKAFAPECNQMPANHCFLLYSYLS